MNGVIRIIPTRISLGMNLSGAGLVSVSIMERSGSFQRHLTQSQSIGIRAKPATWRPAMSERSRRPRSWNTELEDAEVTAEAAGGAESL